MPIQKVQLTTKENIATNNTAKIQHFTIQHFTIQHWLASKFHSVLVRQATLNQVLLHIFCI